MESNLTSKKFHGVLRITAHLGNRKANSKNMDWGKKKEKKKENASVV